MIFRKKIISIFIFISIAGSAFAQNWQLVWSDEFDGSTLNTNVWAPVNMGTGFGNKELQYYSSRPQNLKLENGNLVITALLEDYKVGTASWKYTSAKISTQNLKSFTYGKIEARIKLPGTGNGTWPAFWTLGYGGWPACGELDICEFQGSKPDQWQSNVHTKNYNGTNGTNFHLIKQTPGVSDDFHVWSIEWLPTTETTAGKIKFLFDGVQYWTFSSLSVLPVDYPFNTPIYVILNLAIGGTMGGPVDDTIFPKQMLVDYVRYYQDVQTGVNEVKTKNNPVIPSFFKDNIDIQFPENLAESKTISVYDINGKKIKNLVTSENQTKVDMNATGKGIYLIKVNSGNTVYSQKVIKN